MQSLQEVGPSFTLCNRCKPKKVARQVANEGMLHVANGLATPMQHKLQIKLHRLTLAVELGSTFCNDCRDFLKQLQVAARHVSCNLQWNPVSSVV